MHKPTIPNAGSAPFTLPLAAEEFARAISIGHGRAWLHASAHGISAVEKQIQHALLHSLAYDTQCEGDRGTWVMGLVDAANAGHSAYTYFVEHVHDVPESEYHYWHVSQRSTILAALAKRGFPDAEAALDRLFANSLHEHPNDILGALDIIDVHGEKGLVQVCSALGRRAQANSADTVEHWFLRRFDDSREEGAALKVLEAERGSDSGIDRFLSLREAEEAERLAAKQTRREEDQTSGLGPFAAGYASLPRAYHLLPVEQVIDWIQNAPHRPGSVDGRGWLRGWGIKASDSSLGAILRNLDTTSSPIEQRRYLSIFSARPMPRVSDRVIELAECSDAEVRSRAYSALRNVCDPRVREVGLRSLTPDRVIHGSIELFKSSYQSGDHRALEDALWIPADVSELHALIFDLADVCVKVCHQECLRLMLFIYEYSPCGNCRGKAVDTMALLHITPQWLVDECRFDAHESIRVRFGGPNLDDQDS